MMFSNDIFGRLENSAFMRTLCGLLPKPLQQLLYSRRNFLYALLVHVFFIGVLVFSYDWSAKPSAAKPRVNIIDAVVIDESRVQAELDKLKKTEARRQQLDKERQQKLKAEEQRLAELQKKKRREQKQLAEQKKKRLAEEKRAKDLAIKKKAEQEKLKKLKGQQQAEKKRLAELEKKRQAKAEQIKKQQAEQAQLEAERKQEAERKRVEAERLEQERLKKEREAQQRAEAEKAMQEQLAAEEAALEAERQRSNSREVNRYVEIIKQKVTRNWLRPPSAQSGLSCIVVVSLIPGGEVLNARVTRSSGDPVFDRSVESAVLKASPLPLPPDAALFDRFRELEFVFNPEG